MGWFRALMGGARLTLPCLVLVAKDLRTGFAGNVLYADRGFSSRALLLLVRKRGVSYRCRCGSLRRGRGEWAVVAPVVWVYFPKQRTLVCSIADRRSKPRASTGTSDRLRTNSNLCHCRDVKVYVVRFLSLFATRRLHHHIHFLRASGACTDTSNMLLRRACGQSFNAVGKRGQRGQQFVLCLNSTHPLVALKPPFAAHFHGRTRRPWGC